MKLIIQTDGGSRGNPGPAAGGFVLSTPDGTRQAAKAFFLGRTTNNVAEYTALVKALEAAAEAGATDLTIYSDSELMVRQLNGQYKVKSESIRPLFEQANDLLAQFAKYDIRHVTRDKNTAADKLVNLALDCGHDIEEKPVRSVPVRASHVAQPPSAGITPEGGGATLSFSKSASRGR
jgi:ribonuclease HI